MQVMSASTLVPGDCVVVISNSGRTRDRMDACEIARKKGATTIDILATCMALRIGSDTLQPLLSEMKGNLRSKRYADS